MPRAIDQASHADGEWNDETKPAVRIWTRAELDAEIADRNARFNVLTPAERRVAIMRNVQEQVQSGAIKPINGIFLTAPHAGVLSSAPTLQSRVDSLTECRACARGSIFVSAAQLFDRLPQGKRSLINLSGADHLVDDGTFTWQLLLDIESAFECWGVQEPGSPRAFGEQFEDIVERLLAIAQNIIDNGGEFVP